MSSKHKIKELLHQLKEHSKKSNDEELKHICKKMEQEVAALDSNDPPGEVRPDVPDVPQTT